YLLIVASLWLLANHSATLGDTPRYSAMLTGGQRIDGGNFQDWYLTSAAPRLDNQELMNALNPLVWFCDRTLRPSPAPRAYLEMTTGDRLPCEILAFEPGAASPYTSQPPHFVVRPTINVSSPQSEPYQQVRVLARFVRRIVRSSRADNVALVPNTLVTRQGR